MKQAAQMNIRDYMEIVLRRKWFIVLPFIIIVIGGIIYSYQRPRIYQASTLILIQQQKVPTAYVQPTVTSPIGERLHTISQQIMSRTRLEAIINELSLYQDLRGTLFMEEIVEEMRKDIELQVRGRDSFQLFYEGKNPRVVATVANKIASLFIEENLKVREELAEGTTEFLDRELSRVKKQLVNQETALRRYKEEHIGALPEQMDANLSSLNRLQLQYQAIAGSLENAKERKITLQRQISQISQISGLSSQAGEIGIETGGIGETDMTGSPELAQLKQILAGLQSRYTDKHPDVVRIKNRIKKMEAELVAGGDDEDIPDVSPSDPYGGFDFTETLKVQLLETDFEIKRLAGEQREITAKTAVYQRRVEEIPRREQELLSLKRDYSNTKANYQSLLDKKLNAQLAANMERMQKGERFKILDTARIPQKPFKPNRPRIILLSLLLGLGIGGGLAFGVEYMDHSFRDIDDLERFIGLPVLATIPKIITDDDARRGKIRKRIALASSFGVLALIIATAIVHYFVYRLDFLILK